MPPRPWDNSQRVSSPVDTKEGVFTDDILQLTVNKRQRERRLLQMLDDDDELHSPDWAEKG
jgi:hypothetical protein